MKLKRIVFSLLLVSAVMMSFLTADITAISGDTVGDAKNVIGGILDFELKKNGAADIQSWIDGSLTENAGKSSEWYAIILAKSGDYDFSGYKAALKRYISENKINSATSRMKNALALMAVGEDPNNLNDIAESSVGVQGIMSLIYGLHLLNNGCVCSKYTVATLTDELLSMQFADGGWAIMGENGDIDVTAMTVQALAPQYADNSAVAEAVDRALGFMSDRQLDYGGYQSFGTENPESASQVLIALAQLGLGIDDERFVKNTNTVIDGIIRFAQPDGSFAHTSDGGTNETATIQAYLSLTAYVISAERGEKLYLFDTADKAGSTRADDDVVSADPAAATDSVAAAGDPPVTDVTGGESPRAATPPAGDPSDGSAVGGAGSPASSYKPAAYIIIGGTVLVACVILFILKKRRLSNFVAVLIVGAGAAAFVFFTDFRSSEEYYNGEDTIKTDITGAVTLTIRCDTAVGKIDSAYIPADGIILDTTSFDISEGESVYDILTQAARKYNIQLEAGANGYISGIGYLYEFDCGDLSGWIYHVNGDTPFVMCSEYILSDGDRVEWLYTCDLGNDL